MPSKYVNEIIRKIGSNSKEIIVPVKAEPYAKPANCFYNVDEKIKYDGGFAVYGWSIILGQFLVEAERHAIWQSPHGELIDITPSTSESPTTLFVFENLIYKGQYIDNIRINRTDNKVVDDWIEIYSLISKILSTASRNDNYLEFSKNLEVFYSEYGNLNNLYYSFLVHGGTETTNCFCSSQKPYKKCHGFTNFTKCKQDSKLIDDLLQKNRN